MHRIGEIQSASAASVLERSEARETFSGVRNARATLLAGFTTVRDVGTYRAFVDVALREAIESGTVLGPRMQVAGAYVTVSSGGRASGCMAARWRACGRRSGSASWRRSPRRSAASSWPPTTGA